MHRNLLAVGKATFLLVVIACLCSCVQSPPHRPTGVPSNAVWAGGVDGGSYFLCGVDQKRGVNPCTLWNDATGDVMLQDDFWVSGEDRAATLEEYYGRNVAGSEDWTRPLPEK